mgnify:CR=1 FL=1
MSLGRAYYSFTLGEMTLEDSRQELSTVPLNFNLFGLHLARFELYWLALYIQDGPPLFEERFNKHQIFCKHLLNNCVYQMWSVEYSYRGNTVTNSPADYKSCSVLFVKSTRIFRKQSLVRCY